MKEPALIAELALPAVRLKLLRSKQKHFSSIKAVRSFLFEPFLFFKIGKNATQPRGLLLIAVSRFFCIKDTAQFFSKGFDPMGFLQETGCTIGQQILDSSR